MCLDCNCGHPTDQPSRRLLLEQNLLVRNDSVAGMNRRRFSDAGVRVINLLSSPGSGKTALLERIGRDRALREHMAVVVGDLATDNDARRLQAAGVRAVPITTGQTCHLEASMVAEALAQLDLAELDLLVIENVGNLVCPASYDLGESLRMVMLSVTEGEDKPLKYPATFHSADVVVISKVDLAEACDFDRAHAHHHIRQVAPAARIVEVSARTGQGMEALHASLMERSTVGVG